MRPRKISLRGSTATQLERPGMAWAPLPHERHRARLQLQRVPTSGRHHQRRWHARQKASIQASIPTLS
eukprot:2594109-Pyramimonas_sp.AAC.1